MHRHIQTDTTLSIAADVDKRIDAFRQSYPNIARGIRDTLSTRLQQPAQLKNRLTLLFKQLSWMREIEVCHQFLIEIVEMLSIWPIRFGHAHVWDHYIDAAYELSAQHKRQEHANKLLYLKSRSAYEQGQFDKAIEIAKQALHRLQADKQAKVLALCAAHLVMVYMEKGLSQEAIALMDQTLNDSLVKTVTDPSARYELSLAHFQVLRNRGMINDLLALIDNTESTIIPKVDEHSRGIWYHNVGLYEWYSGRYERAMHYYQSARSIFAKMGDRYEIILMAEIGLLLWYMGYLNDADNIITEWLQRAEEELDSIRIMKLTSYLALIKLAKGDAQTAYQLNEEGFSKASNLGSLADIIRLTGNRGFIRLHMGEYQAARIDLEYDKEHLPLRNQHLAWTLSNLALAYKASGNDEAALAHATEALTLSRERQYGSREILALRALAECTSSHKEKVSLLKEALSLAENTQRMDEAACCLALASLTQDPTYWERGANILHKIGGERWLDGHDIDNPPFIPLFG